MFPDPIPALATQVLEKARARRVKIATAESCTGGLVAGALTDIAGSSDVFDRGFVTYSNDAKHELLGVPQALIAEHGAVSEAVARAMVEGALARSLSHLAVAVTGVAGPGGGSPGKPVGHVQFAWGLKGGAIEAEVKQFGDLGRETVRIKTVEWALRLVLRQLGR